MTQTITIGPIELPNILTLKWSTRRQNEIVSIPYGPQQINTVTGVDLVEYQFTGAIFNDVVAPKLLRRQLTELFNNNTRDFTYIEFSEDDNELTGWFLLDRFSTEIIPNTFHYNFDMTVRRLSLDNAQMVALYAQDDEPLESDYSFAVRRWVGMPNGQGDSSHFLRTGDEGTTRVPIDSDVHYMPYTQTSIINDFRCRVYDTMVPVSLFDNPTDDESGWEERYGLGNNFTGDVIISNGLIRVGYSRSAGSFTTAGTYFIYIWSGTVWERACFDFIDGTVAPISNTTPTITYLTNDKIEFIQWYTINNVSVFYGIKNTLSFGNYYVAKELISRSFPPHALSYIDGNFNTLVTTTHSVVSDNYSSLQMQAASGFNYNMGFLHTKTPVPTNFTGKLFLGYTVPINTRYHFAVFVLPNPPSAGTTLANIGREYLSNSTQKRVLINPKWM